MENFYNSFTDGIIITDYMGEILFINKVLYDKKIINKRLMVIENIVELFEDKDILKKISTSDKLNVEIKVNEDKKIYFETNISHQKWKGIDAIYIRCVELEKINSDNILNNIQCDIRDIESEFEFISKITDNMVYVINYEGKIIKANEEFYNVLGWNSEDILNMKYNDIISTEDLSNAIKGYFKGREVGRNINSISCRFKKRNNKKIWVDCRYTIFEKEKLFLCTAKEITDKEELEDIYEEKLEVEKLKTEFFSSISHEFKTPLNIILATVQLINNKIKCNDILIKENFDVDKYIKYIKQNSYRLLRLVNNLIDINRMDTGYYNISLQNSNIIEVVEEISMSISEYAETKGINIIFDTEVEELIIACDPDKIERIILNLLSNAIKYTPKDGSINILIKERVSDVVISIEDTGIGIAEEDIETIFNRYKQVDNEITKNNQGSGIGLALVKSLVNLHCGSIEVKSKLNEGTKFEIHLPKKIIENSVDNNRIISKDSRIEKCNIEFSDIYK